MATSVTGAGRGAAVPNNKGSEHMTLGVGHLIGPRVMAGGSVTLADGAATVKLPQFEGAATDYVVMTNDITANNASHATLAFSGGNTVITFAGTTTDVLQYLVSKVGRSGAQGLDS